MKDREEDLDLEVIWHGGMELLPPRPSLTNPIFISRKVNGPITENGSPRKVIDPLSIQDDFIDLEWEKLDAKEALDRIEDAP